MSNLVVTAANVLQSPSATVARGVAGATLTAGVPVYLDPADSRLKPADANGAAPANTVKGITVNGAAAGQFVNYVTDDPDFTPGGALTPGTAYALSATAGAIAPIADLVTGDTAIVLFVAKTTTKATLKVLLGGALS